MEGFQTFYVYRLLNVLWQMLEYKKKNYNKHKNTQSKLKNRVKQFRSYMHKQPSKH